MHISVEFQPARLDCWGPDHGQSRWRSWRGLTPGVLAPGRAALASSIEVDDRGDSQHGAGVGVYAEGRELMKIEGPGHDHE